jgi:acyl carrier protein
MEAGMITVKVKEIIGKITGIAPDSIADSATFVDDLGLDSLAILEIAIDVENTFKLRASEEELQNIRSVQDGVSLILQHMGAQTAVITSTT